MCQTQMQVFYISFLELTLPDIEELVNIWVLTLEITSYPSAPVLCPP